METHERWNQFAESICIWYPSSQASPHFLSAKFPHVPAGEQGRKSEESSYEDPGHLFCYCLYCYLTKSGSLYFLICVKLRSQWNQRYKHLLSQQPYLASCRSVYTIDSLVAKHTIETKFSTYFGCMCYLVAKSYPILWDPMDCSLPGFSVHGTLQARILVWVAISSPRGFSRPRERTCASCTAGRFFTNEPSGSSLT